MGRRFKLKESTKRRLKEGAKNILEALVFGWKKHLLKVVLKEVHKAIDKAAAKSKYPAITDSIAHEVKKAINEEALKIK